MFLSLNYFLIPASSHLISFCRIYLFILIHRIYAFLSFTKCTCVILSKLYSSFLFLLYFISKDRFYCYYHFYPSFVYIISASAAALARGEKRERENRSNSTLTQNFGVILLEISTNYNEIV